MYLNQDPLVQHLSRYAKSLRFNGQVRKDYAGMIWQWQEDPLLAHQLLGKSELVCKTGVCYNWKPFKSDRGVTQGGPVLPWIFNIVVNQTSWTRNTTWSYLSCPITRMLLCYPNTNTGLKTTSTDRNESSNSLAVVKVYHLFLFTIDSHTHMKVRVLPMLQTSFLLQTRITATI